MAARCPHCKAAGVRIIYGMPDPDLGAAADRGEVFLGGCVLPEGELPTWHCPACGHEWRLHRPQAAPAKPRR